MNPELTGRGIASHVRIAAAAMILAAAVLPSKLAVAATDYDSLYQGESAFLTVIPGQTYRFTVFFMNTGTLTWQKGTPTQVNLAICRADKTTCNVLSPNASWNDGTWLSQIAYATTTQSAVPPGQLGTFTYTFRPPFGIAHAVYTFNGDLVHAPTLRPIHPEGYYQDATAG